MKMWQIKVNGKAKRSAKTLVEGVEGKTLLQVFVEMTANKDPNDEVTLSQDDICLDDMIDTVVQNLKNYLKEDEQGFWEHVMDLERGYWRRRLTGQCPSLAGVDAEKELQEIYEECEPIQSKN